MSADPQTYLQKRNPHSHDDHILFDEPTHVYTIDGDSNYMSVTTWNHQHFSHFDADKIIANMMKSPKWPQNKYYGKTPDEIKEMWDKNRDEAASAGTKLHWDIECYYNNNIQQNDSIEYSYFKKFTQDFPDLKPFRTEWTIFDKKLKLAGSVDMIFINEKGHLQIYDWKRCKSISKTNAFNKYALTPCINYLPDSNFWIYSLQLNTYKKIIETNYGYKVDELYLVCLHPENKTYLRIKVADLQEEITNLFEERLKQLT